MTEVNKIQNLGEKIKAKRKAERLSAKDLAVKLNLKSENIYKWENGSTPSDPAEYLTITAWLNNSESIPKNKERIANEDSILNMVLPLGDLKVTLKDYVALLIDKAKKAEEREKEYLEIIKSKLISIDTSSKEIGDNLAALTTEIQSEHRAMMDSIDVAAKQPSGTTRAAAGIAEIASEQERVGMGKKAGTGKQS